VFRPLSITLRGVARGAAKEFLPTLFVRMCQELGGSVVSIERDVGYVGRLAGVRGARAATGHVLYGALLAQPGVAVQEVTPVAKRSPLEEKQFRTDFARAGLVHRRLLGVRNRLFSYQAHLDILAEPKP
jgi:hypothetical protein